MKRKILSDNKEKHNIVIKEYDRIVVHEKQLPLVKARLAQDICRHLAFATCKPSGLFDKAGRSMEVLLTPTEVATRACDIAESLFTEYEKRNWIQEVPIEEEFKEEA